MEGVVRKWSNSLLLSFKSKMFSELYWSVSDRTCSPNTKNTLDLVVGLNVYHGPMVVVDSFYRNPL